MNELGIANNRTATGTSGTSGMPGAVLQECGRLTEELHILAEVADNLRVRLEAILGPNVPPEEVGKPQTEKVASPLAESIRGDTQRVRNIRQSLADLISRIEL